MTFFQDSAIVCRKWPGSRVTESEKSAVFEREGLTGFCFARDSSQSSASSSSVFRSLISRAVDIVPGLYGGLRNGWKRHADIEERKQTLYLQMRNVSIYIYTGNKDPAAMLII